MVSGKTWNLITAKRFVRARNNGESYKKIGADMGLSFSRLMSLSKWVIKNAEIIHKSMGTSGDILPPVKKLVKKRAVYEKETRKEIVKLRLAGVSYDAIALKTGMEKKIVINIFHNCKKTQEYKKTREEIPKQNDIIKIATDGLPAGWGNLLP